jgi:hypothetical protein
MTLSRTCHLCVWLCSGRNAARRHWCADSPGLVGRFRRLRRKPPPLMQRSCVRFVSPTSRSGPPLMTLSNTCQLCVWLARAKLPPSRAGYARSACIAAAESKSPIADTGQPHWLCSAKTSRRSPLASFCQLPARRFISLVGPGSSRASARSAGTRGSPELRPRTPMSWRVVHCTVGGCALRCVGRFVSYRP